MKNKLTDLNDYLFEVIEKIQGAETEEERHTAIAEGRVIASIGTAIINNDNVQLKAVQFRVTEMPSRLTTVKVPDILAIEEIERKKEEQ